MAMATELKNVLGEPLKLCCSNPMTGFYRDGFCQTGDRDLGVHVICAEVTDDFLAFTKSQGNDLQTPAPMFNFLGLKAGDRWCLCASRWQEALAAGVAPQIDLNATHEAALKVVPMETLRQYAL
jgi:uncharacterized protein (DUF2237 family)